MNLGEMPLGTQSMNITISFGWWLVPAAIHAYFFWRAARYTVRRGPLSGAYDFGLDVLGAWLVAVCGSMFVWLVYCIVRLLTN